MMAGPHVHLAAMQQTRDQIKKTLQLPCEAGNKIVVMIPNATNNHPGWDVLKEDGNLYDTLELFHEKMIFFLKYVKRDRSKLNVVLFSQMIRFICHYIVDAHSLGHLSTNCRKLEYRLKPCGELVWNKKNLDIDMRVFTNFKVFKQSMIKSSKMIYDQYRKSADSWLFLLSGKFRQMIRESVKYSAEYTSALIRLCWDIA
jgi:hypothetical protein